jgi:ERCC4-type nuclease
VDDREARGCGVSLLLTGKGATVSVRRLRVGDYVIEGKAVLERKRVPDFLSSLFEGRLFGQASRLADSPLRPLLILEGTTSEWTRRQVRREAIQGALLTLSVVYGIPVLRSQSEAETARLIAFTARQLQGGPAATLVRWGRRPRGKRAIQIRVLSSLPSVGLKRAQRLLGHFRSLEAIMAATPNDLEAVVGIGKRTAQSIHWAVHENQNFYHL